MTTGAAARRTAEGEKVGSFLDAVRRPDSRPGRLLPAAPVTAEEPGPHATPSGGEARSVQDVAGSAGRRPTAASEERVTRGAAEAAAAGPGHERISRSPGGAAPETETVIRTPATIDDVFAQLEAPWELRDREVLVRSYSMDSMTTAMLQELRELYGVDMSTLVRQAVKALYVETKWRRERR